MPAVFRFWFRPAGLLSAALVLLFAAPAAAQERGSMLPRVSPNASVGQTIGIATVRLGYSRPSVREREIFGGLVPYGETWRTGANEATTITLSADATVEGQPLAAGTYGLFTIPRPDTWTVIFNKVSEQWGDFSYDASQDALRVEVTPEAAPPHELMTFVFEEVTDTSAVLALYWAETRVPITFEFDTEALIRAQAEEAAETATDWRVPYQYAAWALEQGAYPETALQWAARSVALEEHFANTALQARLLAALGRYREAVATAEEALALAEAQEEPPRGLDQLREDLEGWEAHL